eukprot:scaffold21955_cov23-Phaeocystis_antarctica.AAC.1
MGTRVPSAAVAHSRPHAYRDGSKPRGCGCAQTRRAARAATSYSTTSGGEIGVESSRRTPPASYLIRVR